ncbi:carboxypeptidase M32 [Chroogloeocystis siderophila]|uniref:Metal-dependent carboxypeptidase n=1 Tax=Chroogloeocystis siderophila 5.2 s.c.1 TaxID=247279 RepID=A0A1U7HXU7_9CHRO|nr:carboxypeptidase M32 [Chroogloeocystis siderophila]OKH28437.1 carboxypeptidase [Chroogloeocystis siderophila 5.2 s.c.1]
MQTLEKTHPKLQELKTRLSEINDIESAASLLYWDQATYMPPGGAAARGRQLATLRHIAHTKFTDPAIGQLLEDLSSYETSLPPDSDEASLIRVTRRDYERAVKIPADFTARFSQHSTETYEVWAKARSANDFAAVQPYLEKTLELSRELANFFPGYEHIADPLIAEADYGMKATSVRELFAELRQQLVPIVEAISAQPVIDASCLHQHFPEAEQIAFSLKVIEKLGYDFQRGRQDKTLHPFMTKFSTGDVRITTRIRENDLNEGLFSTIHETGHALYEQGVNRDFEATPLAGGTSSGVHESQSRLWENMVGRSRPFWKFFYPQLQAQFPQQLGDVALETFYRAINKVERSLIRTDADEVTYNLHVMIRFDLELQLLEGTLAVRDLPQAWNERYRSDLGIVPPNDAHGVLQDVHWYGGMIGGMFQGYTLGNLMSAQFFQAALQAHPHISTEIEQGNFDTLHNWLKTNIYQHGRKYTAAEIVELATGKALSIEPFIAYIRRKFGELYSL